MYATILESIENMAIGISDENHKTILRENCLRHIFSWNPFAIKKAEYLKRFIDWSNLKKYHEKKDKIDKLKNKMSSNFYQEEFMSTTIVDSDFHLLINKFTNDDVKIVLAMKALNNQIWHNRISSLWTNVLAILSLVVASISISISIQKSNDVFWEWPVFEPLFELIDADPYWIFIGVCLITSGIVWVVCSYIIGYKFPNLYEKVGKITSFLCALLLTRTSTELLLHLTDITILICIAAAAILSVIPFMIWHITDYLNKKYFSNSNLFNKTGILLGILLWAVSSYLTIMLIVQLPSYAEMYCNRGWEHYKNGNYKNAIKNYNIAILINPNLAVVYNNRGFTYLNNGNYDKAIADYSKAIELDSNFTIAYNNRGLTYHKSGNYDKAITDYSKAIGLDSNAATAYNNRGLTYHYRGNYDKAIADYGKAIELDSNAAIAYNNRGFTYHKSGNYDKAIADYSKGRQLYHNESEKYNTIVDYRQAIILDSNYADAYLKRGLTYHNNGNYDNAISDYNKAIELNSNYAYAYNNRGWAYAHKGNYNKAIEDCNISIQLDPNAHYAYHSRGFTYYKNGDYDKAIKDFTKAILLDSTDTLYYNDRGLVYASKGDYDRAIADYNKAIELNPSYADAYNNRSISYRKKAAITRL